MGCGASAADQKAPQAPLGVRVANQAQNNIVKGRNSFELINLTSQVIAIGDPSVGKTTIIARYSKKNMGGQDTIGVEYFNTEIVVNSQTVQLQIWDTAGQEKFKAITSSYYRDADGVMMVYDITSPSSFKNLQDQWLPEIKEKNPNAIRLVVGNKQDLAHQANVDANNVKKWCTNEGMDFLPVSAKNNKNITEAFQLIVEKIVEEKQGLKK